MGDEGYVFTLGTVFSIYVEMARQLRELPQWSEDASGGSGAPRAHLLLGERFSIDYALLGQGGRTQAVNYYPKSHCITLKSATVRRVREVCALQETPTPAWLPESYILMKHRSTPPPLDAAAQQKLPPWKRGSSVPKDVAEAVADRQRFLQKYSAESSGSGGAPLPPTPAARWIVKPSSGCGGQGIVLSEGTSGVITAVDAEGVSDTAVFVVQRYVDRPYLLEGGRKFDVRAWVLVTSPFDIHLFTEGSLRTSSRAYDAGDLADVNSHITNHSLQEKDPDFGRFESGNEMWYAEFDALLASRGCGRTLGGDVIPQFAEIIKATLGTVAELMRPADGATAHPFQLFGYDFLLDDALKVWLLEINGSPASAEKWKRPMVADILRKAVFPIFPTPFPGPAEGDPVFNLIS